VVAQVRALLRLLLVNRWLEFSVDDDVFQDVYVLGQEPGECGFSEEAEGLQTRFVKGG